MLVRQPAEFSAMHSGLPAQADDPETSFPTEVSGDVYVDPNSGPGLGGPGAHTPAFLGAFALAELQSFQGLPGARGRMQLTCAQL